MGKAHTQRPNGLRCYSAPPVDKSTLQALGSSEDRGKTATKYKSDKRDELVREGYRILGNSGDQWSDLLGSSMSERSFKLPNPMYHIR
ncbi:Sigma1B-adaptin [Orobanche minor]